MRIFSLFILTFTCLALISYFTYFTKKEVAVNKTDSSEVIPESKVSIVPQQVIEEAPRTDSFEEEMRLIGSEDIVAPTPNVIKLAPIPTKLPLALATQKPNQPIAVRRPELAADDARNIFIPLRDEDPQNTENDNLIFNGRFANAQQPTTISIATPTSTKIAQIVLPWARGQSRGYAMLYAMQPGARAVVEQQVQTLLEARIREPYIGILIDGTFSQNFEYIKNILTRLTTEGRSPTLALYITNGATMRKWIDPPIRVLFTDISPGSFNYLIKDDANIRARFVEVVLKAKNLFQFNTSLDTDNKNIAIVMLEDNLERSSYSAMRQLAEEQLEGSATFVRNPCIDCYRPKTEEDPEFIPSDDDTLGDAREEHKVSRENLLIKGDGFTFDGIGFQYPDGTADGSNITSNRLLEFMDQSVARQLSYVGLWRHPWQGVVEGAKKNLHPDERTYKPSSEQQRQFEIIVLRRGLEVELGQ